MTAQEHHHLMIDLSGEEAAVLRSALREHTLRLHGDVAQLRAAEPRPSPRITSLIEAHARAADVVDELLERIPRDLRGP
ncbi:hypothetical protein [Serinibacter arcticus]|uniref:Uncharacterized protein n=1 Tax=Serinibacter arcticus TaxID=1655435 RepID=A0A4Z1DWC3_9MICO|nr:hypothetical protein [Serinibacter arcticus]TGO03885.1 hypothetical protein SERN_2897 [Serinibacter arcticus]